MSNQPEFQKTPTQKRLSIASLSERFPKLAEEHPTLLAIFGIRILPSLLKAKRLERNLTYMIHDSEYAVESVESCLEILSCLKSISKAAWLLLMIDIEAARNWITYAQESAAFFIGQALLILDDLKSNNEEFAKGGAYVEMSEFIQASKATLDEHEKWLPSEPPTQQA